MSDRPGTQPFDAALDLFTRWGAECDAMEASRKALNIEDLLPLCTASTQWRAEAGYHGARRVWFLCIDDHDGIEMPSKGAAKLAAAAPDLLRELVRTRMEIYALRGEI